MAIKNAIIQSAKLDIADRGILQAWLDLDYGGSCQGFGGYVLYLPKSFAHHRILGHAGHFIYRCCEIAGAGTWDDIKGKTIRVKTENGLIIGIGHIVKDDWFEPSKDFKEAI
jgi:hypothetical protein